MSMIFSICPCRLWSRKSLGVSINESCWTVGGLYLAPQIPAGIHWNPVIPVEWNLAEGLAKFAIPGPINSGGIEPFRFWDRNGPRNWPERNPAEWNKYYVISIYSWPDRKVLHSRKNVTWQEKCDIAGKVWHSRRSVTWQESVTWWESVT